MADHRTAEEQAEGGGQVLMPRGWASLEGGEGLVCGFGDRLHTAPAGTVLLEKQVHGTAVVDLGSASCRDAADGFPRLAVEADALVTTTSGTTVGVRTADCVPVLLVAPSARWTAAVHAGWRGTLAGIVVEAVAVARRAGVDPAQLRAALGPSIGPCCYEVSVDLGERFSAAGLHDPAPARWAATSPHLDLRAANRLLLERSGLAAGHIQDVGPCTKCAAGRFHSFRAEPDSEGRQVSWTGWSA